MLNAHAHDALLIGAWLIVLSVIAIAASRFTDPNWTLACVAAVFSVCIFIEETLINMPVVQAALRGRPGTAAVHGACRPVAAETGARGVDCEHGVDVSTVSTVSTASA